MLFAQVKSSKILFHSVPVCPPVLQFIVIDKKKKKKKKSVVYNQVQKVIWIPNREKKSQIYLYRFFSLFMNCFSSHLLDGMIFYS